MEYNLKQRLSKGSKYNKSKSSKKYTLDDIKRLTSNGYILVTKDLWEFIPPKSHIRYVKNGEGSIESRFKPGGFVKSQFVTTNGQHGLVLENKIGGKSDDESYVSFSIVFNDTEKIWKKYPYDSFVEMHLIYNSLATKKIQIEELNKQIIELKNSLAMISQIPR